MGIADPLGARFGLQSHIQLITLLSKGQASPIHFKIVKGGFPLSAPQSEAKQQKDFLAMPV